MSDEPMTKETPLDCGCTSFHLSAEDDCKAVLNRESCQYPKLLAELRLTRQSEAENWILAATFQAERDAARKRCEELEAELNSIKAQGKKRSALVAEYATYRRSAEAHETGLMRTINELDIECAALKAQVKELERPE